MLLLRILLTSLLAAVCFCDGPKRKQVRPSVSTSLGQVIGYPRKSHKDRTYAAFEGIPFAVPPVGALRFQEAQPARPWSGAWDASVIHECLQNEMFQLTAIRGDEDCLYVNVYSPRESPDPAEQLDVVVHIHGGAFMYGAGHTYANPDYFMDHDVVFVTFNYRLGVFGFLSTEDDVVPGNNGLKDQVLALKWVQQHIASFGGNPNSVTITGLSAGAASVHYHLLSPLSKGLFHRAISNSGVATHPWSLQDAALVKAKALANVVGCPDHENRAMVECLKSRPFKHILVKMHFFYAFLMMPLAPFAPVVEKGGKDGAFISENPYALIKKQAPANDVPWLVSHTEDEGTFFIYFLNKNLESLDEQWNDVAPFLLDFNFTLPRELWHKAAEKVKLHYLGKERKISAESLKDLTRMASDRHFRIEAGNAAKFQANTSKSPIYFYNFDYIYEKNPNKTVSHGDDAMFFFKNMLGVKPTERDMKMVKVMMDMLVSFAKTGKPKVEGVEWLPTGPGELTYLNITGPEGFKMESVYELAPTDFWTSLGFLENQNLMQNGDKEEL